MSTGSAALDDMLDSNGKPHEATQSQRNEIRALLNDSLFLFGHYIMGFDQLEPDYHGQMAAWIENWGRPGFKRQMMQSPRDSLKSTLGTIANAPWQICREPHKPVVIFNETAGNTSLWLGAIRRVVENNPLFHAIYGDLIPPGVRVGDPRGKPHGVAWNDSAIDFEGRRLSDPENSIMGYGVGGASTGHHWDKIIFDDLIGPKHRDSIAEMNQVLNWLKTHLELMRPAKGGMAFCICTPWTTTDAYVNLCLDFDYVLMRRSALENENGKPDLHGEPILRRYDKSELLKASKRDWSTFMSQSMCIPIPAGEMALVPHHLRRFRIIDDCIYIEPQFLREGDAQVIPLSKLRKVIILDPAPTEKAEMKAEPSSRNGIIVLGVAPCGRKFILESIAVKKPLPGIVDLLFWTARKWGCDQVFIEEVNFSVSYRHWILDKQNPGQKWSGVRLQPVAMHPGKKDKNKRILDTTPGWKDGLFYVNRDGCEDFIMEYITFHPAADQRDLLDAFAYHYYVNPPLSDSARRAQLKQKRAAEQSRCPITGY